MALHGRQHQPGGPGRSGGGRHDVDGAGPGPAQVLVGEVEQVLVVGVGVHGRHEPTDDVELVVDHLDHRDEAVRRARGVRDHHVLLGVVSWSFLLALDILLLESGLVLRSRTVVQVAMIAPVALLAWLWLGRPPRPTISVSSRCLPRLWAGHRSLSRCSRVLAFYAAAFLRRVPYATPWLVATIAALSVVQRVRRIRPPWQHHGACRFWRPGHSHCASASIVEVRPGACWPRAGLVAGATLQLRGTAFIAYRGLFPIHLLLAATMVIAAVSPGRFARVLQRVCGVLLLLAGAAAVFGEPGWLEDPPAWLFGSYPLFAIVLAASYGYFVRNRSCLAAALGTASLLVGRPGWPCLRRVASERCRVGQDRLGSGVLLGGHVHQPDQGGRAPTLVGAVAPSHRGQTRRRAASPGGRP